MDLYVETPSGELVYYRDRTSSDGAVMLKDDCINSSCPAREDGSDYSEVIHWAEGQPAPGTYTMWAVNYNGNATANFLLQVESDHGHTNFSGSLSGAGEESQRWTFTYGAPCDGSGDDPANPGSDPGQDPGGDPTDPGVDPGGNDGSIDNPSDGGDNPWGGMDEGDGDGDSSFDPAPGGGGDGAGTGCSVATPAAPGGTNAGAILLLAGLVACGWRRRSRV
jgi:MYXO-CTERM domain-containing protein